MANHITKIIKGTGTVFVMMILTSGFAYLYRLLLARNLSLEEYGLFFAIFSFLNLFYGLKQMGTGTAFVRFVSEYRVKKQFKKIKSALISFIIIQFVIFSILSIGILLLSPYLAENYFHNSNAVGILVFLTIASFLTIFISAFRGFLLGLQKMTSYSTVEILQSLLLLVFTYVFIKIGHTIMAPVWAYLVVFCLVGLWSLLLVLRIFPLFKIKTIYDVKIASKLIKYGIPVIVATIASSALGSIDTLLLTYFKSLDEVALYNIALPTANLLRYVPKALSITVFPISAELYFTNKKKLSESIEHIYRYLFVVIVPLSFIMFSFSEEIITILFGEKFLNAASFLKILSLGTLFSSVYFVNQNILLGIDKPNTYTKIILFGAIVNIIFNLTLIPLLGGIGASISNLASYIILLILSSLSIKKYLNNKIPYAKWGYILVSGVLMILMIHLLKSFFELNLWLELSLTITIAGAMYVLMIFLFRIITYEEIVGIIRKFI